MVEPSPPPANPTGAADAQGEADNANDDVWRRILSGDDRGLPRLRRMWGSIPTSPRCKLCAAPFAGPGKVLTRLMMHGPSMVNPLLCSACFGQIRKSPGGAEIPISVLFADIRGSTGIAERTSAGEFRRLVEQFYHRAAKAVDDHDGIVDKFLGDGVMSLFIPLISGAMHASRAIDAGLAVLAAVDDPALIAGGVRVGVGVHSGDAFVGAIGVADRLDFTALGDTVNIAARLGSAAAPGELLVSDAAWRAAGRDPAATRRQETISGRAEPLDVVALGTGPEAAIA